MDKKVEENVIVNEVQVKIYVLLYLASPQTPLWTKRF